MPTPRAQLCVLTTPGKIANSPPFLAAITTEVIKVFYRYFHCRPIDIGLILANRTYRQQKAAPRERTEVCSTETLYQVIQLIAMFTALADECM